MTILVYIIGFDLDISTHTLTWSVTPSSVLRVCSTNNFNSHAHVERDIITLHLHLILKHFNSHAHVERDNMALLNILSTSHFNSHAHVERDYNVTIKR